MYTSAILLAAGIYLYAALKCAEDESLEWGAAALFLVGLLLLPAPFIIGACLGHLP